MVRWLARTICSCAVRLGLCAGGTLFACTHGAARAPPIWSLNWSDCTAPPPKCQQLLLGVRGSTDLHNFS